MRIKLPDALCLMLIAAVFGTAFWLYPDIPQEVPSHWNGRGEVDGYMSKPWGVFLLPLMTVGIYALLWVVPYISPQGYRMEKFAHVVVMLRLAVTAMLATVGLAVLFAASGAPVDMNAIVRGSIGILFIVLGNYLGKVRKNFFIGIRTPWTLASDEVWMRTHRLSGWLFVLAGLVILAGAFVSIGTGIFIAVGSVVVVVPILYSFVIYKQIEGFKADS